VPLRDSLPLYLSLSAAFLLLQVKLGHLQRLDLRGNQMDDRAARVWHSSTEREREREREKGAVLEGP
jgi:hypothetical protein